MSERSSFDLSVLAPGRRPTPSWHVATIAAEIAPALDAIYEDALRPGGALVLSDTPNDDLHSYRAFYEPCKEEGRDSDPDAFLARAGLAVIERRDDAAPLWTRVARKP